MPDGSALAWRCYNSCCCGTFGATWMLFTVCYFKCFWTACPFCDTMPKHKQQPRCQSTKALHYKCDSVDVIDGRLWMGGGVAVNEWVGLDCLHLCEGCISTQCPKSCHVTPDSVHVCSMNTAWTDYIHHVGTIMWPTVSTVFSQVLLTPMFNPYCIHT